MSHSAFRFVIHSMYRVSLYTSLCCFYADHFFICFSLCLLSFHVLGHPAVLSSLMIAFSFSLSLLLTSCIAPTIQLTLRRTTQSIIHKFLTSGFHQELISKKIQHPARRDLGNNEDLRVHWTESLNSVPTWPLKGILKL